MQAMADFQITISASLNVFGLAPPNQWNIMRWGDNWGYGNNPTILAVDKLVAETIEQTDITAKESQVILAEAMAAVDSETGSETLDDGSGYSYVFPRPTTEAEDRSAITYSDVSEPSTTFNGSTEPTTTWSES